MSACMTELEGKAMSGKEIVADPNVNLEAAKRRAEDLLYERDGFQTRLQQFQCGHDIVNESITRIQDKIDRFRAGLKEDQNYMES